MGECGYMFKRIIEYKYIDILLFCSVAAIFLVLIYSSA